MYRTDLDGRHKSGAFAAVLAVHVALGLAVAQLSGSIDLGDVQDAVEIFDLDAVEPVPPPPTPPPPPRQRQAAKPKEKQGGSAPKNIRSEPTPVVAPEPKIQLPTPPAVAAEKPGQGADPTQGAADVRGPGPGAGGAGTGTGSGTGAGSGPGSGEGFAVVRTRLATRPLRGRDFDQTMLERWPPGARTFMRLRVDANGVPTQCIMDIGTGDPALDAEICAVAKQRLRFRPGLNRNRQRVADWFAYGQEPPR